MKKLILAGAAAAAALTAGAANANATINLIDQGGVTGSASELGFKIAAAYWSSVLTNNVTINLGVGYSALGQDIIGSTNSTKYGVAIQGVESFLAGNTSKSALDSSLVVPGFVGTANVTPFGTVGTIKMTRNGPLGTGVLSSTKVVDADNTKDNATVSGTAANLKAMGYTGFTNATDAVVTFSSAFSFDFNPTDGIAAGQMDFIGVAIHEIGHALGFTSGVDTYDYYLAPNGPGKASSFNWGNQTVGNVLDLFRYSAAGNVDWSVGTASYFSTDGGTSVFNGDSYFSTGAYNGDGRQASHFKDTASANGGCDGFNQIGIMDPTFCYGEMGVIQADDLAAMDAIGWNISFDVLQNLGYTKTTAQFYNDYFNATPAVPEAATWAQMVLGFGLLGGAVRLRSRRASLAAA